VDQLSLAQLPVLQLRLVRGSPRGVGGCLLDEVGSGLGGAVQPALSLLAEVARQNLVERQAQDEQRDERNAGDRGSEANVEAREEAAGRRISPR
jgi:hypothetical protein